MPRTSDAGPVSRAPRLPADVRRQDIVATAFHLLATKGFEGLRIRDVADHVQINSATLHHYFPAKQDLIKGIAAHLEQQFATIRAPAIETQPDVPVPLRHLRQELADARYYRRHHPELLMASRELSLRATRDADVAAVVAPLHREWRTAFERILDAGQRERIFRPELIPSAMSAVIVAALWGMSTLLQLSDLEFQQGCDAIEASVVVASLDWGRVPAQMTLQSDQLPRYVE